jgi:hypothetical protein
MVDIYTIRIIPGLYVPSQKYLKGPILVNNRIYGLYGSTVYSMDF